ncbi:MAG TPA: TonB-dependent receptor [Gemmatimonadaceae bacterium]|nr:TonB-dependent receptor [Gemmatimonadaceae bacterium]
MRRPSVSLASSLIAALAAFQPIVAPRLGAQSVPQGIVLDASTGAPVAGALVLHVIGADTVRLTSDANGRFAWPAAAAGELLIRRLGFAPARVTVRRATAGSDEPARIALTPLALQLDATVVTAARRDQRLKDAVVPTELIGRAEIERSGASDVAGVLTEQLGVQLEGGVPAGAGVQLQGLGTNRVLILVDGQPLVGRINGNLDLSRLPTANLERIEVIKGPQSTMYGSDAMGGVINLVTRRPSEGQTEATLQLVSGSRGRRDVHGRVLRGTERLELGLDVGSRALQLAPGIANDRNTNADRLELAPQLRWRLGEAWRAEAGGLFVTEQQRYRTGQLFRFADRDQLAARAGLSWQRGTTRAAALLYRSRFDHLARSSTLDQPQGDVGERDRQMLTELELTYSRTLRALGTDAVLDAGLELRREEIVADRVDGQRRQFDMAEPFAQLTLGSGPLLVTPGARFTWNERWGQFVAPRVAALWRPTSALSVRATIGRGFRAPDFKELYLAFANAQAGYAVEGNEQLRPESSTSAQLNVEWAAARVYLRGSVYENRLRDFIEFVEASTPGLFSYGNVSQARTRGLEGEAGYTAGRARLEGGVAYLDARDTRTGRVLLGRPRWSGRAAVSVGRLLGARASATLVHTGRTPTQRDAEGTVIAVQPEFTRLDLRAVRPLPRGLELAIGVDNVSNRQLGPDWPGFTGRLWHAGLTWNAMR